MKTVTKRELHEQTARVLAAVTSGEPVEVTERGAVRWRITRTAAVDEVTGTIARLRAQGKITPPRADPMPWPDDSHDEPNRVDMLYADSRSSLI